MKFHLLPNRLVRIALLATCLGTFSSLSMGAMTLIDPNLPGTNKQSDDWSNYHLTLFGSPGYGSFPGNAAWPGPINSSTPNAGTNGDAGLYKLANGAGGGPYTGGAGIYHGGTSGASNIDGGKLGVRDTTPVANLQNIAFQIQIGESLGYDFFNKQLPVLNYNGGTQGLAATNWQLLEQFDDGVFATPEGPQPIYINTYLLQWDTRLLGDITDFTIAFNGVQHSQVYLLRLDQSDLFPVPEPASITLAFVAFVGGLGLTYKRRSRSVVNG